MLTLKQFQEKYINKKNVGNTPENKGECVGLVMLWIENLGLSHIWGNAKDIYANANVAEHKKTKNSASAYPLPGSIIVWDSRMGGGYGHTALVVNSSKKDDSFTVLEQNNPLGNGVRLHTYKDWTAVIGWIYPKMLDKNQNLVDVSPDKKSDLESCKDSLEKMTAEKDKYKTRCSILKAELKEKEEKLSKTIVLLNLLEDQKAQAVSTAAERLKTIENFTEDILALQESNLSLKKLLETERDRLKNKDYSLLEIITFLQNYFLRKKR